MLVKKQSYSAIVNSGMKVYPITLLSKIGFQPV